jgi:hypothetical protein
MTLIVPLDYPTRWPPNRPRTASVLGARPGEQVIAPRWKRWLESLESTLRPTG